MEPNSKALEEFKTSNPLICDAVSRLEPSSPWTVSERPKQTDRQAERNI